MFGLFGALSSGTYGVLGSLIGGLNRIFWTLFW